MAVEDDTLLPEDEIDEVEEDQTDEIDEGEDGGDADEEPEEAEGAADGDGQEASGRQEGQVRQPSRAQARVQQALREAKEAKEETARLREQINARPAQPTETSAQRNERLSMMDPEERTNYLLHEQEQKFEGRFAQLQFQTADASDRTAFDGLCARNPVAAKLSSQVEEYLAGMRRNGTNAPRETVLKYVIGDRALANAGKATTRTARRAEDNRTRQAARPSSPRGDTQGDRRGGLSEQEKRAKRLEDMQI